MIRGQISETRLKDRAVIDAVRAVLGMQPLYKIKEHSTSDWLADKTIDYYESREATQKRTVGK